MRLSEEPLIRAEAIQHRIAELAAAISTDFADRELVLVTVLKGAVFFAADLVRQLNIPARLEFVRARSYSGTVSAGRVELTLLPETPLAGKNVLIVEDILDTGRTAAVVVARLMTEMPARLAMCALLDKPSRRQAAVPDGYVGFTIADHFVVGYGLDYEDRYRELPDVWVLESDSEG